MISLSGSSRLLKAMGDETRLRILRLLRREELTGTDLMEILNMGQSRISTHLSLLKEVGLVTDRRAGRHSFFSIVRNPASELLERILEQNGEAPEFETDQRGLEDLMLRKRDEAQSYFDRVAASFGEQILPGRTWEGLARAILKLAPRTRYADLGVGDGLLTLMLAEVAEEVVAVDISPKMLDHLRQRAKVMGFENIKTIKGELDDLPLEEQTIDVAVLSQALHHAEVPLRALQEAARILVPGGRVLVIDLLAHTEDWVREKLQHRHLGFTESRLEDLMREAGLKHISVQRAARDPQPPHFMTLIATAIKPLN